jgi:isoleucyl-tRNA synthetase
MARNFAAKTLESQKKEFMSWGVMGDWDRPYTTMAPDFVKNQLKIFLKLYQNGTLFQRYMPVYWCQSHETFCIDASDK